MKKNSTLFSILLLAASVFFTNQLSAQSSCAWAKKAGGNNEDFGVAVATDALGNVYYLGNFYSQSIVIGTTTLHNQPYIALNYGSEMFLSKYDSCGNFIWAKQAGGDADVRGTGLAVDAAGNSYISGYFNADTAFFGGAIKLLNTAYYDAFVVKYDANGNAVWATKGAGNQQDRANAVAIDASGNVYITGSFASTTINFGGNLIGNFTNDGSTNDVFTAKFDNNGNNIWVKGNTSNAATSGDAIPYGVGVDGSGNVYIAGTFGSNYIRFAVDSVPNSGYNDIFVVKYNSSGTELWLRGAGDIDDDRASSLASDAAGNIYITGYIGAQSTVNFGNSQSITNSAQSLDMFLTKYNTSGTAQWARTSRVDDYTNNEGNNVRLDAAGNPYVIGYYSSDSLNMGPVALYNNSLLVGGGDSIFDIFVAKYKSNGNLSWARTAGGTSHDMGYGIGTGLNNSLYITGEFLSPTITFLGTPTLTLTVSSLAGDGDAFITNNIAASSETANICLVTTDSTSQNNIIIWDKTAYNDVGSFLIYREVQSGVYKRIGMQPYSTLSQFTDTARSVIPANGDPNIGTYRYKIQTLDTAGNYGQLSPYHNTVYFVNNGSGTFNWNVYSVENATITPVTVFDLFRDDNNTANWHIIGTVAGTQTTLNDPNYATYQNTANWRVEACGFSCSPTFRIGNGNSTESAIVKSKSNISNNRGIGVNQLSNANFLSIYPNPSGGSFTIKSEKELGVVSIYNTLGELVYQIKTSDNSLQTDISRLPAGIYTVQAQGKNMRLVKE